MLQVKIWFQNRRMKWRNSKERELLANGGSREQTLPNKNNPNPDLSDASGDRPKMDFSDVSPITSPQRDDEMYGSASENMNYEQPDFNGTSFDQKSSEYGKSKEVFSNMFLDGGSHRNDDLDQFNASSNFDQSDCRDSFEDSDEEEINVT